MNISYFCFEVHNFSVYIIDIPKKTSEGLDGFCVRLYRFVTVRLVDSLPLDRNPPFT